MNNHLFEKLKWIKYVYCDIDGTILNDKQCVSKRTRKAIYKLIREGYYFGLISGRHHLISWKHIHQLKPNSLYIGLNGALFTDIKRKEIVLKIPIEKEIAKKLILFLLRENYFFIFFSENDIYFFSGHKRYYKTQIDSILSKMNSISTKPIEIVQYNEFIDIIDQVFYFCIPESNGEDKMKKLLSEFEKYQDIDFFYTSSSLEIKSSKTNKGIALTKIADIYKITPKQILVFGDSYNDISMFKVAGFSVVMNQAHDDVKKHANFILSFTNNDDGVAHFIEEYFLN